MEHDSYQIEQMLDAAHAYAKAKDAYEAKANNGGHHDSYTLYYEREAVEEAVERFVTELAAFVDHRVQAALASPPSP